MDLKDALAEKAKPQSLRFKELGTGLRVGRVIGNRLLVKTVEDLTAMDQAQKSGLYIPKAVKDANKPMPSKGVVVAVGEGASPEWHEGDMVLFGKYTGTDFACNEQDFRIVNADEVLCTLVDTDESVVAVPTEGE